MGRRSILKKAEEGKFFFTKHAYDQMKVRDIFIKQVYETIQSGRVVDRRPERDGDTLIIIGNRFNGDALKVVVKDTEEPRVITVCYPHESDGD